MAFVKRNVASTPRRIILIVTVLIIIRSLLPVIGLYAINWSLENKMGEYTGKIDDFDLSLYRGAYQLQGLEIKKKTGHLPPILSIEEIDLSIAWRALLHKRLLLDVTLYGADVRLIDSDEKKEQQLGIEENPKGWKAVLDVIVPIEVESLKIHRSALRFTNSSFKKAMPVVLENIELTAADLKTRQKNVLSPFDFKALLQQHAAVHAEGKIDMLAKVPSLDMDYALTKFQLKTINTVLMGYIPLDVTEGELSVYGEVAYLQGKGTGYAKVFFKEGDIIANKQRFQTWKHFFYEIIAAVANWLLKNPDSKTFAFRVPYTISEVTKVKLDTSKVIDSILENRKKELPRTIEKSVSFKDLEAR